MPCVQQVLNQGNCRTPQDRYVPLNPHRQNGYASPEWPPEERDRASHAVIEVGQSRFIIKSGDLLLLEELRLFCESLKGFPRPEVRFTNKLFQCTEQGRLQPWGWQHQPHRIG